jgi:hypothetical protein
VLAAKRNNKLLVGLLLACLVQDAHVCLATVEGLGGLTQAAGESVVDESELENTLERLKDGHLALAASGIGRDLDLGGRADLGLGVVFSVRLLGVRLAHVVLWIGDGGVMRAKTRIARNEGCGCCKASVDRVDAYHDE